MIQEINEALYETLRRKAIESDRKRAHHNLHKHFSEPVQRVVIGLQQGTYVKPHLHPQSHKWEMMIALRGETKLLIFDDNGIVLKEQILSPQGIHSAVELPPNTWHTILPMTEHAIIMEVKEGPYNPDDPSYFASWAPDEGDVETAEFLKWAFKANVGDRYSH